MICIWIFPESRFCLIAFSSDLYIDIFFSSYDPTSNWERDVYQTWNEFRGFIGKDSNYTDQDVISFLTHKYNTTENSISTVCVNLRGIYTQLQKFNHPTHGPIKLHTL